MAGSAWSIRVGVDLDTSDIQSQLNNAAQGAKLDLDTSGAGAGLDAINSKFTLTYQLANKIYQLSKEAIGSMVGQVYEVDKALTEFKKVSDLRGNDLESYTKQLGESGQTVARTTSDMIDAATMFRKSGFSDQEAADLAKIAAMYQNIADTEVSASAAAASIVSQIQAWGRGSIEPMHIIDAYNEVANNFAVGTNDLSQALEISAAGMSTYGNTFEQTIGLVTAGTEIMVGRSSQVARGLNTIAANIVKNSDALEDYGIKVKDPVTGSLKSTYDVLKELKPVWDKMTDSERNALGITLAGKNQYRVLAAIMQNFSHAIDATNTALSSNGSAMKENEAFMESLEAKTTAVKAAFQDLSRGIIDSDLVKGILDLATGFLQIANTDFGHVITQFTLLFGIFTGITGMLDQGLHMDGALFNKAIPYVAAAVAAFVALYNIIDLVQKKLQEKEDSKIFDNVSKEIQNSADKIKEYQDNIDRAKDKLAELQNIPASDRTKEIDDEISRLQTLIHTYEILIEKEKEKLRTEGLSKLRNTQYEDGARVRYKESRSMAYQSSHFDQGVWDAMSRTYDTTAQAAYSVADAVQEVDSEFAEFMGTAPDVNEVVRELANRGFEIATNTHTWEEELSNSIDKLTEYDNKLSHTIDPTDKLLNKTKDLINENKGYYDSLKSVQEAGGELNQQELDFIKTYEKLSNTLDRASISSVTFSDARQAIRDLNKELGDNTATLDDYVNALLNVEGIDTGNLATMLQMLKEFGYLDLDYTQDELQGVLDKINEMDGTSAEVDVGADTSEMEADLAEAEDEINSKGITITSSTDASALDASLGAIQQKITQLSNNPVKIDVQSNMQDAIDKAGAVKDAIKKIPTSHKCTVTITVNGLQQVNSAAASLGAIYDREATVTITVKYVDENGNPTSPPKVATGTDYFAGGYALINDGAPVNGSPAELVVADGKAQIYNNGEPTVVNLPRGAKIYTAAETQAILKNSAFLNNSQGISSFADGNVTIPSEINAETIVYDASDYYQQNVESIKKTKDAFDKWQKAKKHQLELDLITQEQYYLDLEYMNETYLKNISGQQDEYWRYQEEIYKWKKSQLEDENELLERQIELEKALQDVAKAKAQKILVYKDGKFQYMADIDAIAEAQRNVAQVQSKGYASGTLSADAGLHLVGENGPELRVLNGGDGIIPADATKNLLEIAKMGVDGISNTFGKTLQTVYNFAIDNLALPNVSDASEFLDGLKNYAYQYSYANA